MVIEKVPTTAVRSRKTTLEDRIGTDSWRVRGDVTLWYDTKDSLVSVEVSNNPVDQTAITKAFEDGCKAQALY